MKIRPVNDETYPDEKERIINTIIQDIPKLIDLTDDKPFKDLDIDELGQVLHKLEIEIRSRTNYKEEM
jgi:uncharacterized protein YkvS